MFEKKETNKFCFAILRKTNSATALVERFDLNRFTAEMNFIHKTQKLRTCLYRVIKWYLLIVLITPFHLNGHFIGFHPQLKS